MDVKIGRTSDIDRTLSQYRRGNRDIELLDLWRHNSPHDVSTAEAGLHRIAEKFAYEREGEKFVFLQDAYENFSETVGRLLEETAPEMLSETAESDPSSESVDRDMTGSAPVLVEFQGEYYSVNSWRDVVAITAQSISKESGDFHRALNISGSKRDYFKQESNKNELVSAVPIPDTPYYFEGNISANQAKRVIGRLLDEYNYDRSNFKVYLERGLVSGI